MKIFFDTEFTGLHKNTTLISVGCVAEDGRTFYAELTDYDKKQCDDWIKENVIRHLTLDKHEHLELYGSDTTVCGGKEFVKNEFQKWLSEYKDVQFVSDVCHYDMVLLIDLFGSAFDLPNNVNASCHDINQDIARYYKCSEADAFDTSRERILNSFNVDINGNKHNALYDAKVIKAIYDIVTNQ